jgi:hypothetical protein
LFHSCKTGFIPITGEAFMGLRSKLILGAIPLLLIGGLAVYIWGVLHFSYSNGDRQGYVQKLSRKGWVCKTWEGEMAMVSMPGTAPEIFHFSVRDNAIAEKINNTMGKRVVLKYGQHKGVPSKCFGETEYFVTDVRAVE